MGNLVRYQVKDCVATITMDDGKAHAISLQMLTGLGAALYRAAADSAVVLLEGREGIFSAGFPTTPSRPGSWIGWWSPRGCAMSPARRPSR
ncbi:hypothetical protein [Nonomuraea sp. NPDC049784]|uniref:hypothetical protein n=1 Tax=Nonomuraea sp. NPDC049784 TaxID=3154361 RepID=UPI0033DD5212